MIAAYTQHVGLGYARQQDALLVGHVLVQARNRKPVSTPLVGESHLLAIADGVSVSPSPEKASRFVLETLDNLLSNDGGRLSPTVVRRVHVQLCERYAHGRTFGATTTLVAAQCLPDRVIVANVGDSRCYLITASGEWRLLTWDHTILQTMVDAGELPASMLTDGTAPSLWSGLDHCLVANHEESEFSVHIVEAAWSDGDALLLCSDGVHEVLGEAGLRRLFEPSLSPCEQLQAWRSAVLRKGASDDFSIVLALCGDY